MTIFRLYIISIVISLMLSCNSAWNRDSNAAKSQDSKVSTKVLNDKIEKFYNLFESKPEGVLNCEDLVSKIGIGKEMIVEYVNDEVRNWSEEEWNETSYNAVFGIKKENYYVLAIETETPKSTSIVIYTYNIYGFKLSSIPICQQEGIAQITSRLDEDLSIFSLDQSGVSNYEINPRGVYIKTD